METAYQTPLLPTHLQDSLPVLHARSSIFSVPFKCNCLIRKSNAVAEATFKVIKTEFVWNEKFHTLEELKIKLWDYVNWYNHHRIHSSLGYQTPVQYRENNLKKFV